MRVQGSAFALKRPQRVGVFQCLMLYYLHVLTSLSLNCVQMNRSRSTAVAKSPWRHMQGPLYRLPCRLMYKLTGSEEKLQVSLDAEQRRWLEEHSLEELQHEFKRASLKAGGKTGRSSQYRGVSAFKGNWMAQLRVTLKGKEMRAFRQIFKLETDAVYAYDTAKVQWFGRWATSLPIQSVVSIS